MSTTTAPSVSDPASPVNPSAPVAAGLNAALAQIISPGGWKEFFVLIALLAGMFAATIANVVPGVLAVCAGVVASVCFQFARNWDKGDHRDAIGSLIEELLDHQTALAASAQAPGAAPHPAITGALGTITGLLGQIANASAASPEVAAAPAPAPGIMPTGEAALEPGKALGNPPAAGFIRPGTCIIAVAASALLIAILSMSGCAGTKAAWGTSDARKATVAALLHDATQTLGKVAVAELTQAVASNLGGDMAHSAAQAAWSALDVGDIARLINDATGNGAPSVATMAAQLAQSAVAGGATAAEARDAVASAISAAAFGAAAK